MTPQELKNSILQLAIQGKLVEQRPEEGTAEELYKQIQTEKQALVKAGKIKKEKPLPEITEDEIPFEIPESWKWVRLGEVFNIVNGFTPSKSNPDFWSAGEIPWFTIDDVHQQGRFISHTEKHISQKALSKNTDRIVPPDSVLLCCTASVGEYAYTKIPLTTNQQFNAFVTKPECSCAIYPMYVFEFAKTLKGTLIKNAGKTTFNFLSVGKLSLLLFPLPPLAEQKRIVAKIEELLPLVERYEKAWSRLEDFNKRFPGDMQKSILQMAIQGRLVEQRPEEGTGEELYRQIQTEKQALIKAGKIKKEKPLSEITEDEIPFEIPESWKWVRISDLCKSVADGDHQPPPQVPNGIPFLVISNVSDGSLDFSNTRFVPADYFKSLSPERVAEKGDILFTVTGSYGIPVKVDCDASFCFQRHMALLKLMLDWDYLFYALKSPVIKNQCDATATGTAQKTVGLNSLRNMVIPLPPLAEQKRIVARLEELLPLCERLK